MSENPKATPVQLQYLMAQLKAEQHSLLDAAAIEGGPLHRSHRHMIAELENIIAAVIALADERGQSG